MVLSVAEYGEDIALYCLSVHCNRLNALEYVIRILEGDIEDISSEASAYLEAVPLLWNTRVNGKSVPFGDDSENVLRYCNEVPCCSTRKPAVLCLAMTLCVLSCNHLCVHIRLGSVELGYILTECGRNL